jgi:protein-L-isoaspartate O-methyltransferase
MAGMLEALDLRPGHRVLEIGTGTGYNAALLCGRVGDQNVVSVELDPHLAEAACRALATLGLWPSIHAADGMAGVPDSAPFDRIIATAAVDHIPSSWITQLAPGGMILTDLRGSLDGALVRLSSTDDDTVQGRFLNVPAAFMPMRIAVDSPCRQDERWDQVFDKRNPHRGTTTVDPSVVAGNSSLRFLLQLHLAGRRLRGFLRSLDETELAAYSTDGSWCAVDLRGRADGSFSVAQGGPGRLWDTVETCWALWRHAGEPSVERFGVTATDVVDMQNVWLDHPASEHQWPLPL